MADRESRRLSTSQAQSRPRHSMNENPIIQPSDKAISDVIQGLGQNILDMEIMINSLHHDSMKEYLKLFISGVQTVVDNLVAAIDSGGNEVPKNQLVFDTGNYNINDPNAILSGKPATQREMLYRDGSKFVPLEDLEESDLDEMFLAIRTILNDVRGTLLDLSESDIDELSQASLLASKIIISRAKYGHAQLASALNVPLVVEDRSGRSPGDTTKEIDDSNQEIPDKYSKEYQRKAIWDPIAPKLYNQAISLAEQGKAKPATAILLASAILPFAWMPVMVGCPILASDAMIQWGVSTKFGQAIDQGAAEALQVAHLGLILAKVSARQSIRFAVVEFERVGGVQGMFDASVRALSDPIRTAKEGWTWVNMVASGASQQFRMLRGLSM